MIWTLDVTINSSSSSSNTAFIHSPVYRAESANSYPLNNDRELVNQLGVAYLGPSGFSSLPAEDHQNWSLSPLPALLSLTLMQAPLPSLSSTRGVAALASIANE